MLSRRNCIRILLAAVAVAMGAAPVWAYNPPVDTAGPLVATIDGPAVVTETGVPLPVGVVLENRSDRPLSGTVRLGLVDRWKAEPAAAVPFSVKAKSTSRCAFTVTAGEGTYSAHYPIHAYVDFDADGRKQQAHPILVLETKLPARPPVVPAPEWKPQTVDNPGELAIWRLPVYRAVVAVFSQAPKTMPTGWQGSAEPSGAFVSIGTETLAGQAREAITMHPPWKQGLVGSVVIEFPLRLPESKPLVLRFACGVQPEGHDDGVTFRVRAVPLDAPEGELGQILFERHTDAHTWQACEAGLSSLAGKTVRLQLESHPGPKNNTGWDRSFWAEPTLICGTLPAEPPFPPQSNKGSRVLGTLAGKSGPCEVRLWPGRRGLLDAVVGFRRGDQQLFFRGFEVRVLGGRIDDARSPIRLLKATAEPGSDEADGYQVRHHFECDRGPFDLVGRLYVEGAALRTEFRLENAPGPLPWQVVTLEDVAAGPWSRPVEQVYAGDGNVIRRPEAFELGFEGHRLSTSFVGFDFQGGPSLVQGVDVPPKDLEVRPDRRHYSLHTPHASRWAFIPAGDVWEGVKVWREINGLHAANGVRKAAGRFVFDLWGGRYAQSSDQLRRAFRYGLTDSMVVWHNWQRWGYDYRLPSIYPPNPSLGTLEDMQKLVATCKAAGVPIAVHDNYIDFYPDADGFSYDENIAFHPNGTPVKAWLNEGRDARSYRYRADRVEPFLRRNLALVRNGLAPTAYFIDVWSSIRPYDYWTSDGRFFDCVTTRDVWRRQFAWIRDQLGGDAPQISESGHDQLIGWLDGAQTNHLRVGNPVPGDRYGWAVWRIDCQDAERTCWFDAAHHDRFVLHGSGYSARYQGGLDPRMHGIYSDDYLATEVLTGHPAMVSGPFGRDVVRVYWLTSELMRALALGTIDRVDYVGGDLHRQHVRWNGGGQVWVNRGTSDWTIDAIGKTLPQYGFAATVPTAPGTDHRLVSGYPGPVEAAIERLGDDGLIVETARSPRFVFVNGRQPPGTLHAIGLTVEKVEYVGPRQIRLVLRWDAKRPIPPGYRPFLHFCDAKGEIVFQANNRWQKPDGPRAGATEATAEASLPSDCAPGNQYELRYGLYNPAGGARLSLIGPDDGTRRIRLGTLVLEGDAAKHKEPTGVRWTPLSLPPDPWLARQNQEGMPVDFGAVVTAGGCRLSRQHDALVVTPLPCDDGPKFAVRIRPAALPWRLPELRVVAAVSEDGSVLDREAVQREGDAIVLDCRPGVFAFRLEPK